MKYLQLLTAVILLLSGCANDPIKRESSTNINVQVDLLFEYDSIKVYRFSDAGHYHYFTKDMTTTTQSCGKIAHIKKKLKQ